MCPETLRSTSNRIYLNKINRFFIFDQSLIDFRLKISTVSKVFIFKRGKIFFIFVGGTILVHK